MEYIEIPAIILIKCQDTMGMSTITFDIPKDMELNKTMKQIINKKCITLETNEVYILNIAKKQTVNIVCNISEVKNATATLTYTLSDADAKIINKNFAAQPILEKASNKNEAIMAIKNILDTYDQPVICVSDKKQ